MTRARFTPLLVAVALSGCSLGGDSATTASPPAVSRQLPPAPPSSPASVALEGDDAFDVHFKLRPPRAGIVFDLADGDVLWRRRPFERRPIASLTKVMTAIIVATTTRPHDLVTIHADALRYTGRSVGVLKRGKRVRVEALLNAALITSANDAAIALGHHIGGSIRGFARLMNERARLLGLNCTHFVSPYGAEKANQSCAADLAALTRLAMAEHRIARIVRIPYTQIPAPVKGKQLYLPTTNPLLAAGYPGTIGLKTGYTSEAGRCLIAVVRHGRRTLAAVLLDSPNPGEQATRLLERAFRT